MHCDYLPWISYQIPSLAQIYLPVICQVYCVIIFLIAVAATFF